MGPVSTKALATALDLDASTVTRQISALESGGFVQRRPDPLDGRSSTIMLTAAGHQTMAGVEGERRHGIEALVGDWAERERAALARALSRLNTSLLENGRATKDAG